MLGSEDAQAGLLAPGNDLRMSVRFEDGCWLLDTRSIFETLAYPSGGAAETAARTMAARFARSGQGVHVSVEDRRHAVVGTRTYFPCHVSGSMEQAGEGDRT